MKPELPFCREARRMKQVRDFGRMDGGWPVYDFGRSDSLYLFGEDIKFQKKIYNYQELILDFDCRLRTLQTKYLQGSMGPVILG